MAKNVVVLGGSGWERQSRACGREKNIGMFTIVGYVSLIITKESCIRLHHYFIVDHFHSELSLNDVLCPKAFDFELQLCG